jgi:erythromycin esterase
MIETFGNYVSTNLPFRYNGLVYLDETQALHPLHLQAKEKEAVPETYPWGV